MSVIFAYTVVTHCPLCCTANTVHHISTAMSWTWSNHQLLLTPFVLEWNYCTWGTLTSITHCGWKWFRQSNPKSKDCIQTLDKWENSLSRDVSRKPSTLLHSESSFPPLLLIAFLLFRREKTRVSLPRLLLFRKRYLTVQRGLLSEELTVKSMTWLWRAQ